MIFKKDAYIDMISFGRIGIDFNPVIFNKSMEEGQSYTISVGGSPANIAVGAAKLGLSVGIISRVSEDSMGYYAVKSLHKYGIDTSNVKSDKNARISLAVTEVETPDKCHAILYRDNAADLNIKCEDISKEYIAGAKVLLISGTALAKSPSREALLLAVEYARESGTMVVLDLDYRPYTWNSKEEAAVYYNLLCKSCDIIFGTREEYDVIERPYMPQNDDDTKTAHFWLSKKTQIVIIKRGAEGSKVFTREGRVYTGGVYPSVVKKTFGAGDAYAAAFITALIKGKSIPEAVQDGAMSAAIVISKMDCTDAMPTMEELEAFQKRYGEELH